MGQSMVFNGSLTQKTWEDGGEGLGGTSPDSRFLMADLYFYIRRYMTQNNTLILPMVGEVFLQTYIQHFTRMLPYRFCTVSPFFQLEWSPPDCQDLFYVVVGFSSHKLKKKLTKKQEDDCEELVVRVNLVLTLEIRDFFVYPLVFTYNFIYLLPSLIFSTRVPPAAPPRRPQPEELKAELVNVRNGRTLVGTF